MRRRSYKGKGNPRWNGGLRRNNGYWMLYKPEHPHSWQGYVYEHRLVVEKIIGRPLDPDESVHHIDGDKLNNKPVNLIAFRNHSTHLRWHRHMRGLSKKDLESKDIVFDGMTYDPGKHPHVPGVPRPDAVQHRHHFGDER